MTSLLLASAVADLMATSRRAVLVRPPVGLPWSPAPIWRLPSGRVTCSPPAPSITGPQVWVDAAAGGGGDGSFATPFNDLGATVKAPGSSRIINVLDDVTIKRDKMWDGGDAPPAHQLWVRGVSRALSTATSPRRSRPHERPIVTAANHNALSWSLTPATTRTYQTSHASAVNTIAVLDTAWLTARGDARRLTAQASTAAVDANPGSWFLQSGVLYVSLFDDAAPNNTRVWCQLNVTAPRLTQPGFDVRLSDIVFAASGNSNAFEATFSAYNAATRVWLDRCDFKHAPIANGFNCSSAAEVYTLGCAARDNARDGLNLANAATAGVKWFRLDCRAHDNGWDGLNTNNGFTSHGDGAGGLAPTVIGLGCRSGDNHGPLFADVDGAKVWLLDPRGDNSTADAGDSNSAYRLSGTGARAWIDTGFAAGCDRDRVADVGAEISTWRFHGEATDTGTISAYTPH